MLPFFWYMLKVMICSGILFAYYWLFLRNKLFHQYNRFYLLAAMSLSLLLPLLKINFWQPQQDNQAIRMLQVVSAGDEYVNTVVISAQKNNWSLEQLYPVLYCLVSLAFFGVMLRTLWLIRTLLKTYPARQVDSITFINTENEKTPFSFFRFIFWNSSIDINTVTGRQIFKHEVAHIQEKHTHDKFFMNIVIMFCWCNPFAWLYRKELNMIHEFIADKKAVEDSDTSAFAAMILQAAYPKHRFELTNNFFYSPIKRRLLMLGKNKNPRVNYIGRIMVLPLIVLVFAAFSLKAKNNNPKTVASFNAISTSINTADAPLIDSLFAILEAEKISTDTLPGKNTTISLVPASKPLYILDGKEVGSDIIHDLDPGAISSIDVIKNATAIASYGENAKDGVILIKTKAALRLSYSDEADPENALYVINGKVMGKGKTANTGINKIIAEKLEIVWLKKQEAISKYGDQGVDGACEVSYTNGEVIRFSDNNKSNTTEAFADNNDPVLQLGAVSGGRIQSDYLKNIKEISLSTGYRFVSAMVYFSGPGLDNNVVQARLNSASLSGIGKYINLCEDDAKIVFDDVMYADQFGVIRKMNNPPVFIIATNNANQITVVGKKLDLAGLQKEKQKLMLLQTVPDKPAVVNTDKLTEVLVSGYPTRSYEKQKIELDKNYLAFVTTELIPTFTGGPEAWRKFLSANLKAGVPVDNGARAGKYTVVLKFVVNTDGSLSDIRCENDPGFGTCAEALRFIRTTPRWQPAMQNGKPVRAYLKQPITFLVEDQDSRPAKVSLYKTGYAATVSQLFAFDTRYKKEIKVPACVAVDFNATYSGKLATTLKNK